MINDLKPRFIVDAMLGKLAKKLRLLGFDSLFFSDIEDSKLTEIAKKDNRIVITKDSQLIQILKKHHVDTIEITTENEIEQIYQISLARKLGKFTIDGDSSRCTICNGELQGVKKNEIENKIPKGVFKLNNEFWMCKDCKKLYWEGTHIRNLQKFVSIINGI